jgi:hypothetical protein
MRTGRRIAWELGDDGKWAQVWRMSTGEFDRVRPPGHCAGDGTAHHQKGHATHPHRICFQVKTGRILHRNRSGGSRRIIHQPRPWFGTSNAAVVARLPHVGQRRGRGRLSGGSASPRVHVSVFMPSSVVVSEDGLRDAEAGEARAPDRRCSACARTPGSRRRAARRRAGSEIAVGDAHAATGSAAVAVPGSSNATGRSLAGAPVKYRRFTGNRFFFAFSVGRRQDGLRQHGSGGAFGPLPPTGAGGPRALKASRSASPLAVCLRRTDSLPRYFWRLMALPAFAFSMRSDPRSPPPRPVTSP